MEITKTYFDSAFQGMRDYFDSNFATKEYLDQRINVFATKDDINGFVKKDDIKSFATKDDLKGFATKGDLGVFATKNDIKGFVTKDDFKDFAKKDDLKSFATKDDLTHLETRLIDRVETSIENLARMTANEFSRVYKKFDVLEEKLTEKIAKVDEHLSSRITGLENRIDDLALNRATRDQVEKINRRLVNVETRVGLAT